MPFELLNEIKFFVFLNISLKTNWKKILMFWKYIYFLYKVALFHFNEVGCQAIFKRTKTKKQ